MSVSLLLVPAVIAAVAGTASAGAGGAAATLASGWRDPGTRALTVATRMRDLGILTEAVAQIGGRVAHANSDELTATVGDLHLEMHRGADGIWAAHIDADRAVTVGEANELMLALDRAYLARVQQVVADRIRQNADAAGFRVVSDTREADESVRIVLQATSTAEGA